MSERLDVACRAARAAGGTIIEHLRRGVTIGHKQPHNLVSAADLAAEELIVATVRAAFPGDAVFAEEKHKDSLAAEAVWVVDPLDGTNNFAHGYPAFCTSIGLALKGRFVLGAVYDPVADELFAAEVGQGATLNGQPLHVSAAAALPEALVATGFYYDRDVLLRQTLAAIQALFMAGIHGIRRSGSAARDLCFVAAGRLDGFFEYRLQPWDYAAGAVIVREAGGRASDSHDRDLDLQSFDVAASNGALHQALLGVVGPLRPPPDRVAGG